MCLLRVKVKYLQEEKIFTDIAIVEIKNGLLRLYNIMLECVFETQISNVRSMYLNSVDAHLILELS